MLDKSIPYYNIFMHRPWAPPPAPRLPEGYRFALFQRGDEAAWAWIETAVLEFDSEAEALGRFAGSYLPYWRELERRCVFVEEPGGKKVATATIWWGDTGERRDPWLHWVGVHPGWQGKGLGKAVTAKALAQMAAVDGERDCYLHTQTWSHRAVGMYRQLGFRISREPGLGGHANDEYLPAEKLLEEVYRREGRR